MSSDFGAAKAFYAAVFGYEYGDRPTADFSYATLLPGGQANHFRRTVAG